MRHRHQVSGGRGPVLRHRQRLDRPGQFDKAAQYYKQALATDPTLAKASYNLALAYAQLNRPDDAIAILTKLLAADPKNTAVMSTLGWTYHQEGKDEDALKRYDDVLAVSPADQDALYNSAIVLWKLDRKPAARERLERLLSYTPEALDALYAAGSLSLAMDDPASAADYLSRYLAKKPEDVDAWYLAAAGAERQQRYSKALDAYDKILTLDSKQSEASFGEARLLLTVVEDPQKGLDELQQALSTGFHDTDAVKVLLADSTLLERDKVEAALKDKGLLPAPSDAASPGSNAETPGAGPPGAGSSGAGAPGASPPPGRAPTSP
ncbi:MAG TPA: tetratricopeptide repeat protein [Spirochaetia bacterium]|nr:tetratricopeptide repeat protein [Spirochaetia bacterium]